MSSGLRRRRFLQMASALGLGAELGPWASLRTITPLRAEEARVKPEMVRFRPEIEPVVRLIEETPRERIIETGIIQLKKGLSYKDLLAGLFLAGIRNIKPRPVGFKFHAVMVINSAHVLGQSAAVTERLLPLLWALDNFKASQAQDVKEGDWVLEPLDECRLPKTQRAREEFVRAMEVWDSDAADAAIAALCRSSGAAHTMEPLWRYAVRDQRNIGHKAIFAAQCWRTLQAIGWEHAEPVLRSLVFGLLDLQGDTRPRPVGPYESNLENAGKIRPEWSVGREDAAATRALLAVIRQATPEAASEEAVKLLNQGIAPGSLWDAAILSACELLMHSPGILSLHATTSTNALHYIYTTSGDDLTRRLALLQAVGWQPLFRGRIKPGQSTGIDALPASPDLRLSGGDTAVGEIFATINDDRTKAATKAMAYLSGGGSSELIFDAARRMIFHKGRDSHDYKYGAALWEEYLWSTEPKWRNHIVAASMFNFPGARTPDSPLMIRARDALAAVMS
ncbi:MAG TPA: hypothetical protein VFF52_06635 [Isosphaeraceae bacterium]|nr:hypothetical protein [Isosphaeraceae bacterium]